MLTWLESYPWCMMCLWSLVYSEFGPRPDFFGLGATAGGGALDGLECVGTGAGDGAIESKKE